MGNSESNVHDCIISTTKCKKKGTKVNFENMTNENNPGNDESKVETYEHDSCKGENFKYPNIHNNVYPKNTISNVTIPHVKSSNVTFPNVTSPNVTSPNITSQNVAFLENSYPNLNNIHSDDILYRPSCPTKEELFDDDKFTIKQKYVSTKKKNSIKSMIKPPSNLINLTDFIKRWVIWKEQLLVFLNLMDENKTKYHQWGNFLLNFMGPIGQEILEKLVFNTGEDKNNFVILMYKFDAYHSFNVAIKSENENIMDYIERLKGDAVRNLKNIDQILKQKLANDISKNESCKERFIALTSSRLPDFNFDKTFMFLTLVEIAFLWNLSNQCNLKESQTCNSCGKSHSKEQCFAKNKECNKCKRRNHFAKYCPGLMYINNCGFCGGDHGARQCLAYGEICSKCNKPNHFSWMCSKLTVKNCRFCGQSHAMDRNKCPAKNSVCSICKITGHYEVKCRSKLNSDAEK